uniref:Transposon TX1 uncharacterized n=1 Tax=Cajanus cajan TaxID=3821 RepID=A0A151U3H6_CAJCA|nr:Transposon TX1 uncharacterized [Cajanus cajan]
MEESIQNPWCMLGDFNVVLKDSKHKGSSSSACFRELLWFQKSPCKWLEFGDRNTSYFHGTTVIRRRKSSIATLQNEECGWIENKQELELMVTAIGLDGFQAIFYQTQWDTVGPTLYHLIQDIEQTSKKISKINNTLITLIPKVNNVVSLKQMRPISLCNVSYKVITKALATRLKRLMEGLVSPNQCSFVPHRQTTDNIIITQEVIHSMKHRSGKKGWMDIKINLEKAYDRLNWSFVKDTLLDISLP